MASIELAFQVSGEIQDGRATRTDAGRYELLELMSSSARCEVWCAIDTRTEEARVVKIASRGYQFRDDGLAVSALGHRNLVGTIEHGWLPDGRAYVVQPCIYALSLRRYLAAGALSFTDAVSVIVQIAHALAAAHAAGVVHGAPAKLELDTQHEAVERVLRRALDDDPTHRWPDVGTFVMTLTGDPASASWLARGTLQNMCA